MKLTEERLVEMILEELDAMGEGAGGMRRRRGTVSPGFKGGGKYVPREKGTEEEEAKRTAKRALDLAARPTLMMIRKDIENEKKTGKPVVAQYDVEQDVYDYIKKLSRDDQDVLGRLTIKED